VEHASQALHRVDLAKGEVSTDLDAPFCSEEDVGRVGRLDKNAFDRLLSGVIRSLSAAVPLAKVLDSSPYDRAMKRFHDYLKDNPEFQRDAFRSVFETAEKMKLLCNRLGTFSSSFATRRTMADLNRVVREVSSSLEAPSAERVRLELGEIPLLWIDVDEIASVLRNLLLNAVEAVSAAGAVTVRTSQSNGRVEVVVQDDGHGISREFMEKDLFVPFRTTKTAGLGIGLFQSLKIIEAHGGSIDVESEAGKGTTVRAALPVPATPEPPISQE
jgi:signal transduction histidine kinase